MSKPIVSIIMGSKSDLDTMQHAADILEELNIPYEMKIISAHRTPNLMFKYAEKANQRGIAPDLSWRRGLILYIQRKKLCQHKPWTTVWQSQT